MPRNCGSSSPKTIEKTVASSSATVLDDGLDRPGAEPEARRAGPTTSTPIDGWAR